VISYLTLLEKGDIVVVFASLVFDKVGLLVLWPLQLTGLMNNYRTCLKHQKLTNPQHLLYSTKFDTSTASQGPGCPM
jgi:hypothetical protein